MNCCVWPLSLKSPSLSTLWNSDPSFGEVSWLCDTLLPGIFCYSQPYPTLLSGETYFYFKEDTPPPTFLEEYDLCVLFPWYIICSYHCCAVLVHCSAFKAYSPDGLRFFINAGIVLFIPVMLWHRVDFFFLFLADFTFSTRSLHCPNFKVICISSLLY